MTDKELIERLRAGARDEAKASQWLADAKTKQNNAAEGLLLDKPGYLGIAPEHTAQWKAAARIAELGAQVERKIIAAYPALPPDLAGLVERLNDSATFISDHYTAVDKAGQWSNLRHAAAATILALQAQVAELQDQITEVPQFVRQRDSARAAIAEAVKLIEEAVEFTPPDDPPGTNERGEALSEDQMRHIRGQLSYDRRVRHFDALREFVDRMKQKGAGSSMLQSRVKPWMVACFGPEIAADKIERNHRFLEEALELVQACGCTRDDAHDLVDYVFGRDQGDINQEVGGVMITLAALCLANGFDMHAAGEIELKRIWSKIEMIRARQAAKPQHSPRPSHEPRGSAGGAVDDAGAKLIAKWIGYSWDGLREGRIEGYPQWAFDGANHKHFQGGKQDLRNLADAIKQRGYEAAREQAVELAEKEAWREQTIVSAVPTHRNVGVYERGADIARRTAAAIRSMQSPTQEGK